MNPIATKIASKPNLSGRIEKMLPTGMTLDTASAGFKNQGQFIAALHVSQNLKIPFADLKAAMLGTPVTPTGPTTPTTNTTPPATNTTTPTTSTTTTTTNTTTTSAGPMSLGQAIHKLRPSANATGEAQHAQTQATTDVSSTSTTPTSTSTSTSTSAAGRR